MQAVQNTQDYLQGNLSKHLVQLTIPLVLGNILQELYNTIDLRVTPLPVTMTA